MVCVTDDKQENKEVELTGPTDEEIEEDYNLNLANGRKNLLCGDFPEAVTCLQLACTLQSQRYGDTSHECAECFYFYGKSLLELARVENGVLGNALKGVPETEDSESEKDEEQQFEKTKNLPTNERQQLRQEVEAAMATENEDEGESQEEGEPENEGEKVEKKEEPKEKVEDIKDEGEKGKNEGETEKVEKKDLPEEKKEKVDTPSETAEAATSSGSKAEIAPIPVEELEDPDEVSNMQLAWEMIELAKFLYLKKPKTDESRLNVAQCHLLLGDLGLEQENYSQAIGDYLESLVIHKEVLPAVDRRLAETHYNLGLAYSFDKRYDNALEHFNAALNVLESRIDFLNEKIDENDRKKENTEETLEECTEMGEIRSIIPSINAKIEDVISMKKEDSKLKNLKGETSTGFKATTEKVCTVIPIRKSASASSEEKSEACDISHLVRRKRSMPEDEPTTDKSENGAAINKKLKQETNGNGKEIEKTEVAANGNNGHSDVQKKEPMTASELKAKKAEVATEVAMET